MTQMERLKKVVARLRDKDGRSWDRKQTQESLKPEVIEEAAEVVCGINIYEKTGASENLKEELGDPPPAGRDAGTDRRGGRTLFAGGCRGGRRRQDDPKASPRLWRREDAGGGRGVCCLGGDQEEGEDRKRVGESHLPAAFQESEQLLLQAEARKGYRPQQ